MARWRLLASHYLQTIPKTEWEYTEISRDSGKQARVRHEVPLYLNPGNPGDHNYPGEIIVAHQGRGANKKDILFIGEPTPDMEPVDDEAEKISRELAPKWQHPIDDLPISGGDYSQSLIRRLENDLTEAIRRVATGAKPQ